MTKLAIKDFFQGLIITTQSTIEGLVETELNNQEKKEKLDKTVIAFINTAMTTLPLNWVARWVITHYIIPYVDDLTQYIYDLLKARVKGVTK